MALVWTTDMGREAGHWECKRVGFVGAAHLGVTLWRAEDQGAEGPVHTVIHSVYLPLHQWALW